MKAPSRSEVIEMFRCLVNGGKTREEVASWAQKWVIADEPPEMDEDLWEAITFLSSADMISTDRPYLYLTEDFVHELRRLSGS